MSQATLKARRALSCKFKLNHCCDPYHDEMCLKPIRVDPIRAETFFSSWTQFL